MKVLLRRVAGASALTLFAAAGMLLAIPTTIDALGDERRFSERPNNTKHNKPHPQRSDYPGQG